MKSKVIFLFLVLLSWIISFSSCEKKNFDEMPPETRSGKNTFGCLIDGDLFVGGCCAPWMTDVLDAGYRKESNRLFIIAYGKMNGSPAGMISIGVNSPQQKSTQKISLAYYFPPTGSCFNFTAWNDGLCTITRLDTINKIASGRFEFVGRCSDEDFNVTDSTTTTQITQGRFDVKFIIYNN